MQGLLLTTIIENATYTFNKNYICTAMKYSQFTGIVAALALIAICFLPWIEVPSLHKEFNGLNGYVNPDLNFGRQYIPHCFFGVIMIAFFSITRIWAKRTNIFIAFINLGWAIKNYLIFSMCRSGDCPSVKPALYLLIILSVIIQVMTFLPKMEMKDK